MKMLGVILLAVAMGQLVVGGRAMAAPSTPPAPAAQPAQPAQPAPPVQPLDPYTAPPPSYGSPPPGYGPGYPSPAQSFMMYESQRKNIGLALVLEFFVPGLGSLYGDHAVGSLITWALMIAGISMLVYGISQLVKDTDRIGESRNSSAGTFGLTAGLALILGGRIYGFVDSYMSTDEYNKKLRQRMGLPVVVNFGLGRVGTGPAMSFGPRLVVTF